MKVGRGKIIGGGKKEAGKIVWVNEGMSPHRKEKKKSLKPSYFAFPFHECPN